MTYHPDHPAWMLELCPLLQLESYYQIIIWHVIPNLPPHTPRPSSKVELGTWLVCASHILIEYRIVMRGKSSEGLDYIVLGFDSISFKCLKNMKTVYQDENNVVLVENSVE